MNRLFTAALLLLLIQPQRHLEAAWGDVMGSRPNVIFLLLDDAGWTDTGGFGGRMLTPHLDRLGAEGMRFTDAHSPAPNCSPSRAGILTGRIPARTGIYSYLPEGHPMHLRAEEVTVAELARQAGYRTGHFGKWHLSDLDDDSQPGPLDQGFEDSLATSNNAAPTHRDPVNFRRNGQRVGKLEGYSCQIVVDETLEWLDAIDAGEKEAAPFLACVWFHEPHTPIASPPELVEGCLKRHPELSRREAEYLANIENVDRAVERLLAWLDHRGLARDTVIWFTSDNGPLNAFSKGDLRGFKYFYRLNPSLALRDGDWAILARTDDADRPKAHPLLREDMARVLESKPVSWELYHLGRDRGQTHDLSADQPQRLETMKRQLADLHADVLAEGVSWDIPENYRAGTARRVWNSE